MTIHLGTIKQEESGPTIQIEDEITTEQHRELIQAIKEIQNLENNRRLFEIVFRNKNEFVETVNRDAEKMMGSLSVAGNREIYFEHHLNFNRLFLNYLSSIKTFIDHNDRAIKKKFGDNSIEALEFKKITHYYFDNFFCYRFLIKLRDYAQHCGMPLSNFNISTIRNDDGSYSSSMKIDFNPQELLANFSEWKKIVKENLQNIKSPFPLAPLIDEMTKVLMGFWQAVDVINGANVLKSAKYVRTLTDHLRAEKTDVCIFTNLRDNLDGSLKNFESFTIPFDIIDKLDISGSN
jgi:hypothetical protein